MQNKDNKINSFLCFKIGNETFAVDVNSVLNILEMMPITKVPQAPAYMSGIINLRGMVLPVIDSHLKLGLPEITYTTNTCIIIFDIQIESQLTKIGLIVDSVLEVIEISENQIGAPPAIGTRFKSEIINGTIILDEQFVMILDINRLLVADDLSVVAIENKIV